MQGDDCCPGRIVLSIKGRDKGRYFIIMALASRDRVMVADGVTHKIQKVKKKNIKHLKATPIICEEMQKALEEKVFLDNSHIRKALQIRGYGTDKPQGGM